MSDIADNEGMTRRRWVGVAVLLVAAVALWVGVLGPEPNHTVTHRTGDGWNDNLIVYCDKGQYRGGGESEICAEAWDEATAERPWWIAAGVAIAIAGVVLVAPRRAPRVLIGEGTA